MRLQDLVYDMGAAIVTMFALALVCAPVTYFTWNNIVIPLSNNFLRPMDLPTAIVFNFSWNLFTFFKLQKRDIIIAHPNGDSEENEVES